jgi:hypothetical protein
MTDHPKPLTAILGEPGQRDEQGFSNINTVLLTRPIIITDAAGHVVYTKQTEDTQKAADNHIRNAGYRRVGQWTDGVAAIERVPLGAKLKKPLIALAVLGLVVAGFSISQARYEAAGPQAAEEACHEAVKTKLPAAATPDFKTTSSRKNSAQKYGGYLYVVNGDLRSLDVGGQVRDMTYRCEAYVADGGSVHNVTAGTTWK